MKLETGYIVVGERTPKADGLIGDFEYAFAGTGFSNSSGLLSVRQSRYFLSYDSKNLHFAVQSEIASDTASRDSERVEVFIGSVNGSSADSHFIFTPSGAGTISGNTWTLEAAIPFAVLGVETTPEKHDWRINIARVSASPEETTAIAPPLGGLSDRGPRVRLHLRPDAPDIQINGLFDLSRYVSAAQIAARPKDPRSEIACVLITDSSKAYGLRTSIHTLFSQGKDTPLKPRGEALLDFALNEIRIEEKNRR